MFVCLCFWCTAIYIMALDSMFLCSLPLFWPTHKNQYQTELPNWSFDDEWREWGADTHLRGKESSKLVLFMLFFLVIFPDFLITLNLHHFHFIFGTLFEVERINECYMRHTVILYHSLWVLRVWNDQKRRSERKRGAKQSNAEWKRSSLKFSIYRWAKISF